ncbi:MAG TPA: trypsin-like peptidase domain-containing protein [Anaeromyxobacter sp.]|nr:trypsin-like peptidase domain-containing protein [Anaeromyxobacter sp.]
MVPALLLLVVAQAPAPDLAALAEKTRPAVVKLVARDAFGNELGNGTGFFVSASGRILTNHHVVRGAPNLVAILEGKREVRILGVLADDEESDLAVLQAEDGRYPVLQLEEGRDPRVGEQVAVIGSPIGLAGTLSTGIVAAVRAEGADLGPYGKAPSWQLQISAAISPGSSGSPVLAEDGKVVGVAVGLISVGQALNFAIPAKRARALLATIAPDARPRPLVDVARGARKVGRNLAVSAAIFLLLGVGAWLALRRPGRSSPAARHDA